MDVTTVRQGQVCSSFQPPKCGQEAITHFAKTEHHTRVWDFAGLLRPWAGLSAARAGRYFHRKAGFMCVLKFHEFGGLNNLSGLSRTDRFRKRRIIWRTLAFLPGITSYSRTLETF